MEKTFNGRPPNLGRPFPGSDASNFAQNKPQVNFDDQGYPVATQTRRVRRLLGEVMQLPGEQAADGILTVTCLVDVGFAHPGRLGSLLPFVSPNL